VTCKVKKLILLCLLIVGLSMACGGGAANDERAAIEDTIRGYVRTFNAGDFTQCLTYFIDYGDEAEALASLSWMRGFLGEITLQGIDDIAISGETATALVTSLIWGEPDTDQMHFKKENGVWKIVWAQDTSPPPSIPTEECLPGTVTVAPELQGIVQVEHCLWLEEDGEFYVWYQVWNIGAQTVCPYISLYAYDAGGQEYHLESLGGIVGPGSCMGCCDGGGWPVGLLTVTHYKIIVESTENCS